MKRLKNDWTPHPYQNRAVDFLLNTPSGALFLDPGLGKTSITLEAVSILLKIKAVKKVLVVAPLRVCQLVWRQEAQRWADFNHLRFELLHGPGKDKALKRDADIYLINPEGVKWLSEKYFMREFPFDVVVFDELTKWKNPSAQRSKAIRPLLRQARFRWGLTGTPIPNGYMDLFGQFLVLDDGATLGKFITRYRDLYFTQSADGFGWVLKKDSAKLIEERIKPHVLRMSAQDYLALPDLIEDVRWVEMPGDAHDLYKTMKKEMLVELEDGVVSAPTAAAVYGKLKQMAGGAVYTSEAGNVLNIHDAKMEALEDLIEELGDKQLLVAYEFRHELSRLMERFPGADYLGSGVTATKAAEIERRWNNGELRLLFAHPASAGHGLNLQRGGAEHLCWFGPSWDLELYDQFIRRIYRQGTVASRVVVHTLACKDTIDEKVMVAREAKDVTQQTLLRALNAEIANDKFVPEPPAGGDQPEINTKEELMSKLNKLVRQGAHSDEDDRPPTRVAWGSRPVDDEDDDEPQPVKKTARRVQQEDDDDFPSQRERIVSKVRGSYENEPEEMPVSVQARDMFSKAVRQEIEDDEEDDKPAPAKPKLVKAEILASAETPARGRPRKEAVAAPTPLPDLPPAASTGPEIDYDRLASALLNQLFKRLAGS